MLGRRCPYIYAPIQPAAVLPTCVQTASLRARSSKWPLASGTLLSPTPSPLDAPNAARRPAAAGDRGACNGESKRQSMDARLLLHAQKVQCFKTRASDLEFNTIVQSEWGDRGAKGRLVYVSARDGACIFWMPRCASPAPGAKKGGSIRRRGDRPLARSATGEKERGQAQRRCLYCWKGWRAWGRG